MTHTEHGVAVDVSRRVLGAVLTGDAAIGATTLAVDDLADFDEGGGQVTVNGEVVTYTATVEDVDDENRGTLTLAAATVGAHTAGDRVDLYPESFELWALCEVDDDGEGIEAEVPHTLIPLLPEGTYDVTTGPTVVLERDDDEDDWYVVDVLGGAPAIDGTYLLPGTVQADSFQAGDLSPGGVLDENGLRAYDAAGVQTFDLSFLDGDFTAVGSIATGEAPAQRVELGPATSYPERNEVRFFTGSAGETAPARIFHSDDSGKPRMRIEPGTKTTSVGSRPYILLRSGDAVDQSSMTLDSDSVDLIGFQELSLLSFGTLTIASPNNVTFISSPHGVDVNQMRLGSVGTSTFRTSVRTAAAPTLCTAATRPATPYNGQQIYETDTTRTLIYDGTAWKLVGRETFPRAHVYLNADVNRTNGGNAVLVLAGSNNTFEGGFSRSGSELVFPEAGYYDIYAQIAVDGIGAAGATGSFQTSLRKNAAGSISGGTEIAQDYAPAGGAGKRSGQMTLISQLMAANDTVELFPLNNTGVTATCLSGKTHTLLQAALRS